VRSEAVTKEILIQYCDLREEIKELRKRIDDTKAQIKKIKTDGDVTDSVTCGKKGNKPLGTVKITGFPKPEYERKIRLLEVREYMLAVKETDLLEITNEVEKYIESLSDSRMRRIMNFRYIDNMTWLQVAINIGRSATADSVRMEHDRFILYQ
jgi:hypothetical protein